jgi:hypothetical protein
MRPTTVVVVDNGSGDSSADRIAAQFPQVEVIPVRENRGYAAGMNEGIARVLELGAESVLLLTHECVLDRRCLELLVERLEENQQTGAVGPLLCYLSDPQKVWSAGGIIDRARWHTDHRGTGDPATKWFEQRCQVVDWLDGACILIRAEVLRQAGTLNERYFLYFEESEFLIRVARLGWSVECVPAALAFQEPSPMLPYLRTRNQLGFIAATASHRYLVKELIRVGVDLTGDLLRPVSQDRKETIRARFWGVIDFVRGRWGPPPDSLAIPTAYWDAPEHT